MSSLSPESQTIRKCSTQIYDVLDCRVSVVWFANHLFSKQFITHTELGNVVSATGIGNYTKISQLMQSVISQISVNPEKFAEFIGILQEEPVLDDLVKLLGDTYDIFGYVWISMDASRDTRTLVAILSGETKMSVKSQASSQNRTGKKRGQKQSIQDLELSMKNVTNVLKPVSKWYDLGLQLDVPVYELKEIQSNYPRDDSRCKSEMLSFWFCNAEEQSWDVIADALEKIRYRNLANEIRGGPSDDTPDETVECTSSVDENVSLRKVQEQDLAGAPDTDTSSQTEEHNSSVAETVRPRKVHVPQKEQHHEGAPHAVPIRRSPRVPSPPAHNKRCLCLFVITTAVGVAGLIWWFGSHHDMPIVSELFCAIQGPGSPSCPKSPIHPNSPTRPSSSSSPNEQAPIPNSGCHRIEAEHLVRDELRTVLDWKVLGQELRLPQEILVAIDDDNQKAEHKRRETVRAWFDSKEKPCWETVVGALKRMVLNNLANEIAERYGVKYNEV